MEKPITSSNGLKENENIAFNGMNDISLLSIDVMKVAGNHLQKRHGLSHLNNS